MYRRIDHLFLSGELAQADAASTQSRDLIAGSGPVWIERFRLQQAQVRLYQGRVKDVVTLLKDEPPNAAASRPNAIRRDTLLAIAYTRTGDLPRAERALANAQALCDNDGARAGVHMAEGVISLEHGKFPEAEHAFELSLESARLADDRLQQAQALLNLGVSALRKEHYEDALSRFDEASKAAQSIGAGLVLMKATGSVGSTYRKLGDYRSATAKAEEARNKAAELGVVTDEGRWLEDEGLSQYRLGDFTAARISYEKAYRLASSIGNHEAMVDAQVALGYLDLQSGDTNAALAQARSATTVASARMNENGMFQPLLLEARVLARAGATEEARTKLISLDQRTVSKPSIQWEVESAAANLYGQTGDRTASDQWFERAIGTFDRQRSSFHKVESRLPFSEHGSDLYLGYMEQLIREGRTGEALAVLDRSRAETLADGLGLSHDQRAGSARMPSPMALAARLDGTLLVYCLRPETSYLWAYTPTHSAFYRLPGREAILSLIEKHRTAILDAKDILADPNAPGRALYDMLVAPAQSLTGSNGKVFLIGDQGLHRLNFETLLAPGSPNHFWIEDATITNAASLSVLAARNPPAGSGVKRQAPTLLLIGDPVYRNGGRAELLNASREVASIASHFPADQRQILTGSLASPAAYASSDPSRFSYIHFVAHGTASELNPLDSSVILSPVPGHPEAYKLYARSILDQHISAELVTISACYGSGSRAYAGEGLVGLAWAFLRAGSHNVIGALWEISDASTPQLMGDMYTQLGAGAAPDAALRSAKLTMLHSEGVFRKPLYWAPFQLYAGA